MDGAIEYLSSPATVLDVVCGKHYTAALVLVHKAVGAAHQHGACCGTSVHCDLYSVTHACHQPSLALQPVQGTGRSHPTGSQATAAAPPARPRAW